MDLVLLHSKSDRGLDWSFLGSLPPGASFARASAGTRLNASGQVENLAENVPRFDNTLAGTPLGILVEPQRTNGVCNNTMLGAVVGTPGTLPSNWTAYTGSTGLTRSVVGLGTENGMSYIDLRFSGTPTATNKYQLLFDTGAGISAAKNDVWTASIYARIVSGSLTNINTTSLGITEINGSGTWLADNWGSITFTTTFDRYSVTKTLGNVSCAGIYPVLALYVTNGQAVDVTLRFYGPQLEKGGAASSIIFTVGVAATRAADQLSFKIPASVSALRYVFDNDTTQDASVSAGSYTVPTTLNRSRIKRIYTP